MGGILLLSYYCNSESRRLRDEVAKGSRSLIISAPISGLCLSLFNHTALFLFICLISFILPITNQCKQSFEHSHEFVLRL